MSRVKIEFNEGIVDAIDTIEATDDIQEWHDFLKARPDMAELDQAPRKYTEQDLNSSPWTEPDDGPSIWVFLSWGAIVCCLIAAGIHWWIF